MQCAGRQQPKASIVGRVRARGSAAAPARSSAPHVGASAESNFQLAKCDSQFAVRTGTVVLMLGDFSPPNLCGHHRNGTSPERTGSTDASQIAPESRVGRRSNAAVIVNRRLARRRRREARSSPFVARSLRSIAGVSSDPARPRYRTSRRMTSEARRRVQMYDKARRSHGERITAFPGTGLVLLHTLASRGRIEHRLVYSVGPLASIGERKIRAASRFVRIAPP